MEYLVFQLLFWFSQQGSVDRPQRVNRAIDRTEAAWQGQYYAVAAQQLTLLTQELRYADPTARLNLAHANYLANDTTRARPQYARLDSLRNPPLASLARNQLGVLAANVRADDQALAYFANALRADPTNEAARYNYELLAKRQQARQEPPPPPDREPSAFAKRLKAQADALVRDRRYPDAFRLMQSGLAKDPTVATFKDFTQRLGKVAGIK